MQTMILEEKFECYAILEIFGHMRLAGKVTEATIGGCSFMRLDVPDVGDKRGFTRFYGQGAIYSMTPCTEEIARAAAASFEAQAVSVYDLDKETLKRLMAPRTAIYMGDEDDEGRGE